MKSPDIKSDSLQTLACDGRRTGASPRRLILFALLLLPLASAPFAAAQAVTGDAAMEAAEEIADPAEENAVETEPTDPVEAPGVVAGDDAATVGFPESVDPPGALPADLESSPTDEAPDFTLGVGPVYVIPVHGEVEKGLYLILNRAMREAEAADASAIVLDMHTPGGAVNAAILIRDRLVKSEIPTYTYVDNMAISAGSFIALATDSIIMAPGSNIGGALPIQMGAAGAEGVGEKFESVFASEMRKTAKHKGHPADIAEGFSNPDVVIEGLKKEGEILTLDYDTAVEFGLAEYIAPTLEEMLEREGLGQAPVEYVTYTPTDRIARFLSSPTIMGLLMMLGMGGIYLEVRTPGFGIPGLVGITSLALYFFGSYLANLSGYMEIIFFALGLILLALEIFVIPGFGIPGIAGILMMLGAVFFALFNWAPEGFDFHFERVEIPLWTMTISLLALFPVMYLLGKILPYTPLYAALDLEPSGAPMQPNAVTVPAVAFEIGQTGTATTALRPAGTASIAGRRVDVVSEGEYIAGGSPIRIVQIEGNRIVVRSAAGEA